MILPTEDRSIEHSFLCSRKKPRLVTNTLESKHDMTIALHCKFRLCELLGYVTHELHNFTTLHTVTPHGPPYAALEWPESQPADDEDCMKEK